ncbi:Lamin-like protein [Glycine soja]|nr:Lamin-like protein [Glycine soja]
MMMITMMLVNMAKSELHYVGGNKTTWAANVNFTEWSSSEHFHLMDWIYFGYERHEYSVLEVNKTSYENCIEKGFIQNVSRGAGRDVFQLTEFKTYYFLSGGGHCWDGVKVAITVTEGVASPTPAPSPKTGAPTPSPQSDVPATSPKSGAPAPSPKTSSASDDNRVNQMLLVFIFVLICGISSNNISY